MSRKGALRLYSDLPWTILSQKYDGRNHRLWTRAFALQDRPLYKAEVLPLFSLLVPAQTDVIEANGETWSSTYDVVACFYAAKHYQVMILKKRTGWQYYCNSCAVAEIDQEHRQVRFVDLDLDLLVDAEGSMRIADRDEFADHAIAYGYPQALQDRVEQDLEELMRQVRQRRGVFSPHYAVPDRTDVT